MIGNKVQTDTRTDRKTVNLKAQHIRRKAQNKIQKLNKETKIDRRRRTTSKMN